MLLHVSKAVSALEADYQVLTLALEWVIRISTCTSSSGRVSLIKHR